MEIRDMIKNKRIKLGLTMAEVAKACGVSEATISRWESGNIVNMRRSKLSALAKVLELPPAALIDPSTDAHPHEKGVRIPVLGFVQAGIPVDAIENIVDYEEIPESMARHGEYFGLLIRGNSMEPKMSDGDLVIIKKQPDVDSGDVAVVLVGGDEATIKKVKKRPDGILLIPNNRDYEPMFFSNQDILDLPVTVIGKAVELRAKL